MAKLIPLSLPSFAFAITLAAAAAAAISSAVDFDVTNNAIDTPGGARFDSDIGDDYTSQVLADASSFIWDTFAQPTDDDRKNVQRVTCSIEDMGGVANTLGNAIRVSAQYIASFSGDVRTEITGVLYHEDTHVWQWDGQGQAPRKLIEGVADYVRLKAGFEPLDGHWVKPGEGDSWNQGYDVTARFLDYCDGLDSGFVAKLNAKMKDGYSDSYFVDLLGKSPEQLFSDYKAAYGG